MKNWLESILNAGVEADASHFDRRSIRLTNLCVLIGATAMVLGTIAFSFIDWVAFLPANLATLLSALILTYAIRLNRTGHPLSASVVMNLFLALPIFVDVRLFIGPSLGLQYFFILFALLPIFTINDRSRRLTLVLSLLDVMFFLLAYMNLPLFDLDQSLNETLRATIYNVFLFSTLVAIVLVVNFYQRLLFASEKALQERSDSLSTTLEEATRLATEDSLTGIMNRRHMEQQIHVEIARAARHDSKLSLILFDLDHFKVVNDTYGHEKGDEALKRTARLASETVRSTDLIGRWGGEEFVVLLPETEMDGAMVVAEKIRQNLDESTEQLYMPTASFGVVELHSGENFISLYSRADIAMYSAKHAGRNRVAAFVEGAIAPKPVARIEWMVEWESGEVEIDRQHRRILEIGNEIISLSLSVISPRDKAGELLDTLMEDIRQHFDNEERVMANIHYNDYDIHRIEHQRLLDRALSMKRAYERGEEGLISFFVFILEEIVSGHVLNWDTGYFAPLQASLHRTRK